MGGNIIECPGLEKVATLRPGHMLKNTEWLEFISEDWCCKRKP